jgi:transposase
LPGWPPNSPDLNPIEMIWAIMKPRVKKLVPQTKAELEEIIAKV